MPYEHDNQGHLLIIATILLAGYSAFFGNYHSTALFLALAATFTAAKEFDLLWPRLYEFFRHHLYLIWHRYHALRS
jgi:hypothetical protein